MTLRIVILALILGCLAAVNAAAMTVDEAYSALNHRRTVFDESATKASRTQAGSLKRLFSLAEIGTILKVRAYHAHSRGDKAAYAAVLKDYDALIDVSKRQDAAAEIKPAQDLVVGAIVQQRGVLAASADKPVAVLSRNELARNREVQKVHGDLIRAYNMLMSAFPNEPTVNKNAFYDYLCALDFL
jgi:hypothetical protein